MKAPCKALALLMAMSMLTGSASFATAEGSVYTEEKTKDGWIRVIQENGPELGYSPDSGVSIIEADGLAFKDLNKNGTLDTYEDWRQDDDTRARDLAARMTTDEISGLMVYDGSMTANLSDKLDDSQKAKLDDHVRGFQNGSVTAPVKDQVKWYNAIQAYTEASALGVPAQFCSDPRNSGWGIGVSAYPDNLALAATFDPELAREAAEQMSKEYRAMGITTLLGPQIDLDSEPRWGRNTGAFGEDPALSRDMARAMTDGYQSTYDGDGNDLGWGAESINTTVKHYVAEGAAQEGREGHDATGSFNIFPGDNFNAHLIPFVDGALNLDGNTEMASGIMSSYSIAYSESEEYGELVGSSFSEYKLGLLRSYGFDGVICTDWQVLDDSGKVWGVEGLTPAERVCKALVAGVDQFGGESDLTPIREGIELFKEQLGEEAAVASLQNSARRLLKNAFQLGLFENPYELVSDSVKLVQSKDDEALDMQEKTVVMLKNDGVIAPKASEEKPTVYIPLVYTPATIGFVGQNFSSADLPVDTKVLNKYFNVVTDTVSETLTGPADENGQPTLAYEDIIRASAEELAACDYAVVFTRTPKNTSYWSITGGYDMFRNIYVPITLQYGEYVADSDAVDTVSFAGRTLKEETNTPYGTFTNVTQENQSYYGETAIQDYATDLNMIRYAVENMPEDKAIIVAVNASGKSPLAQMIVSEFEADADAILYGFNINNSAYLDIIVGNVEPSALLPVQLPKDMETVETQYEDVPRDMECYVDAAGNSYDFGFGLNWSGVISDARTEKYVVPALTEPERQPAA